MFRIFSNRKRRGVMPILKPIYFASVLVLALLSTATAQESATVQRSTLTITAAAADGRVRLTAPSSVVQMHVEVYGLNGEKVFDQEIRGGNVFDWHLQNGQAQRLGPGGFRCGVTGQRGPREPAPKPGGGEGGGGPAAW